MIRWRLGQGPGRYPGPPPDPLRAGPRRHRHVPAQGREEPGRDRKLTGDINFYRKIAEYGTESDPARLQLRRRVPNIANRGIIEFIEVLKLDVAILDDLLGASQEHKIKPKKFAQTDIDEVIVGHTNEPEYKKLQSNEFMEALRDRTVKIDVPYVTRLSDEIHIYQKDYNSRKVRGKKIAPHTLEVAAMWAILTRLEKSPRTPGLTLAPEAFKLYNRQDLARGSPRTTSRRLREEAEPRGDARDQPEVRPGQDLQRPGRPRRRAARSTRSWSSTMLEAGLKHHSLINSDEVKKHYKHLLAVVKEEYEDIVKNEVQRAHRRRRGRPVPPLRQLHRQRQGLHPAARRSRISTPARPRSLDERLMRSIEEKDRHPREPQGRLPPRDHELHRAHLTLDGKKFDYKTNERLQKALELKLFQDQKDTIKLTSLVSSVIDKDTPGEDRHRQGTSDPQLRLRRGLGDRRAGTMSPASSPEGTSSAYSH